MTFHSSHFISYQPSSNEHHITITDGSHTSVTCYGKIKLNPSLNLQNVLYVPKLSTNLISIHKLTKDLNCVVTFFHSHCVFQDLVTGRMIEVAKEQGGLYHFPNKKASGGPGQKLLSFCHQFHSKTSTSQILLQHKHLGHPPFALLKSMFPSLFLKESVELFNCDVCQFVKHHVNFPSSSNRSIEPFCLFA